MKTIMLTFILCWMLSIALAKEIKPIERVAMDQLESKPPLTIKLSMMDQSVDDMYSGCTEKMAVKVRREYFPREMKDTSFQKAWTSAKSCLKRAQKKRKPKDKALTNDHLQAICVYTAEDPNIYKQFNGIVRSDAQHYTDSFPYHALHFWLTSAIQILGANNQTCHTTVRRSKDNFTGVVNQMIRFGSFASTSYNKNLIQFGNETCFYIKTCLGAYLKDYSLFKDEDEVLIPPYEIFQITEITRSPHNRLDNCKQVLVLNSVGVHSSLNCKAAHNGFETVK